MDNFIDCKWSKAGLSLPCHNYNVTEVQLSSEAYQNISHWDQRNKKWIKSNQSKSDLTAALHTFDVLCKSILTILQVSDSIRTGTEDLTAIRETFNHEMVSLLVIDLFLCDFSKITLSKQYSNYYSKKKTKLREQRFTMYQVSQKKRTRLMSHNTASIASILKIRLGLGR